MPKFMGTAYFCSREEAYIYFAKEGNDKEAVKEYIKEGLIHIGVPPNVDELNLSIDEGRYFIKEKKKDLRLLLLEECNRQCEGCCNKDFDLKNLPIETRFSGYNLIMLTGGEPMLRPDVVLKTINKIRKQTSTSDIILYTAKVDEIKKVMHLIRYLQGVTLTLHEQSDVKPMQEFSRAIAKTSLLHQRSFRLNIFEGIKMPNVIHRFWKVKDNIKWIKNCPLPKNEVFKRI